MPSADDRVLAVDVGGTFTDCVAWTSGRLGVTKVPSTRDQSDGVMQGAEELTGERKATALLHGSTVATNALLERKGADTLLITDAGFEDVIEIGRQDRPSLYDSYADRVEPLVAREDRWAAAEPAALARRVAERKPESIAVSLAYSYLDGSAESEIARALSDEGLPVSVSHRVVGEFREFERTSTTVLNAYLSPGVAGYLNRLATEAAALADRVQVMRSSGGLMEVSDAASLAAALLVSGPAGGVVAASRLGENRGFERVVAFDMGGTSTDVCRIERGRAEIAYEREVAGHVCRMPSVDVNTVGAGGGSIAWVDAGGSLRVGPHSAGADPGPACYGRGGEHATVTDAHLALGRIDSAARLGGSLRLRPEAAHAVLERLGVMAGLEPSPLAAGILEVVEAHMERAIRTVSVEQGADPRQATLIAYGGAGGLHATALARRLGMARVAIPPYAGVFSALGLLMAPPRVDGARSVDPNAGDFSPALEALASRVTDSYVDTFGRLPVEVGWSVDMRYRGQSHEISVPVVEGASTGAAEAAFHRLHAEINGFARSDDPVEAVTVRAVAEGRAWLGWEDLPRLAPGPLPEPGRRAMTVNERDVEADVWWRPDLPSGVELVGPAVIEEEVGTTVLLPGETGSVAVDGTIEVVL